MAKKNKHQQVSPETQEQSLKLAKATQRPGQTKEQTKLIAQGIQKGIDQYKKQQKVKSRELNKKLHKVSQKLSSTAEETDIQLKENIIYKQAKLPWFLLLTSWAGFAVYYFMPLTKPLL